MSALEKLYTTQDLADRYGRKRRAVAEKAWRGEWPSLKILGEYRFTAEMVEWIDKQHERWPQNEAAPVAQPQPKPQPAPQTRQRRTPQPPPPAPNGNVRQLRAKERPNRVRRTG